MPNGHKVARPRPLGYLRCCKSAEVQALPHRGEEEADELNLTLSCYGYMLGMSQPQ